MEAYGWRDAEIGRHVMAEALVREMRHRQAGHGESTVGA